MSEAALKLKDIHNKASAANRSSLSFTTRESAELVVAFSGAIGSGLAEVVHQTTEVLKDLGYTVVSIKLSRLIEALGVKLNLISPPNQSNLGKKTERYKVLQQAGNDLRQKFASDVLAELAISQIAIHRTKQGSGKPIEDIVPGRVAYLIDQLKHPDEVTLLRSVYGDLFFLVGILASEKQREKNLVAEGLEGSAAEAVMERDRKDEVDHGGRIRNFVGEAD